MSCSESEGDHSRNYAIGREFEKVAATFYQSHGFEILARNWRAGHKEIDLIARKENLIVFVEVKSSKNKKFGHPAERVDRKKIRNLHEAAQQYIISSEIENCDLRFDVVTFVDGQIEHFPDAFQVDQ